MPRATTQGDRNEDRAHVLTPPRGVGLTEPPPLAIPHEVGFEDTGAIEDPEARRQARLDRSGGDTDQRLHYVEESVHDLRGDFREHRAEFKGLRLDVGKLLEIEQTKRVGAIELDTARAKADIAKRVSIHDARVKFATWFVTGAIGTALVERIVAWLLGVH